MNNRNFRMENSLEANYLVIDLDEPFELDDIAMKVVRRDCPDFLIPFTLTNRNDHISLRYRLVNTIALEYADMNMRKSDFVRLYLNLLTPFVKGKDWFLDYHNICVDRRYIFLDRRSLAVSFIYVPEYSYRSTDEEIIDFLKDMINRVEIIDDREFLISLYRSFSNGRVTLSGLYQMFRDEEGRMVRGEYSDRNQSRETWTNRNDGMGNNIGNNIGNTTSGNGNAGNGTAGNYGGSQTGGFREGIKTENDSSKGNKINTISAPAEDTKKKGFGGLFGGKKQEKEKKQEDLDVLSEVFSSDGGNDDFLKDIFGEDSKKDKKHKDKEKAVPRKEKKDKSLFGGLKNKEEAPAPKPVRSGNNNTVSSENIFVSYGGGNSDETEIDTTPGSGSASACCLDLIDSVVPGAIRRIDLNFTKPYITIGRESSDEVQPDVAFSRDFKRIARRQARIERNGGRLYVIDLGSANHTFLDGQVLIPNQAYLLNDGMELTFTDSKPVRYRVRSQGM